MNEELAGFLFQGQEENSHKPVILGSGAETRESSSAAALQLSGNFRGSFQGSYLIMARISPQDGKGAIILPGF